MTGGGDITSSNWPNLVKCLCQNGGVCQPIRSRLGEFISHAQNHPRPYKQLNLLPIKYYSSKQYPILRPCLLLSHSFDLFCISQSQMQYLTPYHVATYLLLIFSAAHTLGGLFLPHGYGVDANDVLASMKSIHFDFNGS